MEENEYRQMYRAAIPNRCAFEKGILARRCACPLARRRNLAEREAVACTSSSGRTQCGTWLTMLREKAVFALQLREHSQVLPHAKEIKVQIGGLLGLAECLYESSGKGARQGGRQVDDVHGLLEAGRKRFGELQRLPFDEIVRAVVRFSGRKRRRDHR